MGDNCELAYDPCVSSPCGNGTCNQLRNERTDDVDYSCTCLPGFTGLTCDVNIDDCVGVTCPTYQECRDGVNNYTCSCPDGFTGKSYYAKCLSTFFLFFKFIFSYFDFQVKRVVMIQTNARKVHAKMEARVRTSWLTTHARVQRDGREIIVIQTLMSAPNTITFVTLESASMVLEGSSVSVSQVTLENVATPSTMSVCRARV